MPENENTMQMPCPDKSGAEMSRLRIHNRMGYHLVLFGLLLMLGDVRDHPSEQRWRRRRCKEKKIKIKNKK